MGEIIGVKTIKDAQALSEISDDMFQYWEEPQEDGTTLTKCKIRPLYGAGVEGDDIMLFIDTDGRSMKVVSTEDGFKKTVFR